MEIDGDRRHMTCCRITTDGILPSHYRQSIVLYLPPLKAAIFLYLPISTYHYFFSNHSWIAVS